LFDIKKNFVDEALSAPHLFTDLAKVELYIAESYRTRAIIEMLQNADDAESTNFLIHQYGDKLIVANNGNSFTKQDITALCRSGSSTKTRGVGKIGYRGIGFKSVVGICDNVKILSENLLFEFSKTLTKKTLNTTTDVPLIRIPHTLNLKYKNDLLSSLPILSSYTTIFILSGIDIRLVTEEVEQFNSSSILFLNKVELLTFNINGKSKSIKKNYSSNTKVEINNHGNVEYWHVACEPNETSKVAFKLNSDSIVPASEAESVIHAFLPTEENPGSYLKINGDFSTEPSRKRVDLDNLSQNSYYECCSIIAKEINNALRENRLVGIFSVFTNTPNSRFKKLLKENLFNILNKNLHIKENKVELINLRMKPKWLNYKDYSISSFETIPQDIDERYPEARDFFIWLGVKELSAEDYIASCNFKKLSFLGCSELISHVAKKFRFNLPTETLENLKTIAIFPTTTGEIKSSTAIVNEQLHADYLMLLANAENDSDIRIILKRIGIENATPSPQPRASQRVTEPRLEANPHSTTETQQKKPENKIPPQFQKWRTAELNVKEWFSNRPEVLLARDVSKSHVGYDVEVKLKNGIDYFVEVKKVNSFNDPFEITNNEYAIGSQLKSNYLIAIVILSGDEFSIKFIKNPTNVLAFEKRIKSISWVCDSYEKQLTNL
jgi:hypothetical protein